MKCCNFYNLSRLFVIIVRSNNEPLQDFVLPTFHCLIAIDDFPILVPEAVPSAFHFQITFYQAGSYHLFAFSAGQKGVQKVYRIPFASFEFFPFVEYCVSSVPEFDLPEQHFEGLVLIRNEALQLKLDSFSR